VTIVRNLGSIACLALISPFRRPSPPGRLGNRAIRRLFLLSCGTVARNLFFPFSFASYRPPAYDDATCPFPGDGCHHGDISAALALIGIIMRSRSGVALGDSRHAVRLGGMDSEDGAAAPSRIELAATRTPKTARK
jgi:hypothetical protein